MALVAPQIEAVDQSDVAVNHRQAALDTHTDTQVALLRGMLDAMRKPNSSDAFEVLKSRFSDRAMTVHLETLKTFEA